MKLMSTRHHTDGHLRSNGIKSLKGFALTVPLGLRMSAVWPIWHNKHNRKTQVEVIVHEPDKGNCVRTFHIFLTHAY